MKLTRILLLAMGLAIVAPAVFGQGPVAEKKETQEAGKARPVDAQGDPLPAGAVARFGSVRFRTTGRSRATALSPDGKTLASGGGEQVVLIDLENGKRGRIFQVEGEVLKLAFLEEGKLLVAVDSQGFARFWSVATGQAAHKPLNVLENRADRFFTETALNANGLLVVREDGQFNVWDLQRCIRTRQFNTTTQDSAIAVAPDGKTIAAFDQSNAIFCDVATGQTRKAISDSRGYPGWLQFSPDGRMLVTTGTYHAYRVCDVATGNEKRVFGRPEKNAFAMAISIDSQLLAAIPGSEIVVWDMLSGKEISQMSRVAEGFVISTRSMHFSPDKKRLITVANALIQVWDVATGLEITDGSRPQHPAAGLVASADGTLLAGIYGHTLRVWEVKTAKERFHLPEAVWRTPSAFSGDHKTMAYAHTDHSVRLCDVSTGKELARFQGHTKEVTAVSFSKDGSTLFSVNEDGGKRSWDIVTKKERSRQVPEMPKIDMDHKMRYQNATAAQTPPELGSRCQSPDGRTFAGIGRGDSLDIFDVATGRIVLSLRSARKDRGSSTLTMGKPLAFSADGRLLAASSFKGSEIEIWDTTTGKLVHTIATEAGQVEGLAFVGTGDLLASSGGDTTILLWDVLHLRNKA